MKIRESKNLVYQHLPLARGEVTNRIELSKCLLESFNLIDDSIELHFKNGREAAIRAKNLQGERELDLIVEKLEHFLDKSYEDILDMDI
ncbi:MAG: hypothetical protein CO146_00315 [Candidatus Nealsonbacteria bacterium CG_4_9_14_3_um_filter_37_29]|uniref:Uncharacterized protein n=1 Tax=Candidatus Nealsonbacteria bacterium CG_4_9_14_3_um_filter_37_29 TaxID=1974696 RepID=A0A2M7Z3Z5_9BACT|nr:MAG: hypothetical protein CO146_00315 [Candidatus Nealsonbacteria bacterium CG_4_9_14_3_um_filter_37_29]